MPFLPPNQQRQSIGRKDRNKETVIDVLHRYQQRKNTYINRMQLTNGVYQFEVNVEGDEWYWKKSKVEFQHAGNGVNVIVAFYGNVCLVAICRQKSPSALL